jgi:hypothetical protein
LARTAIEQSSFFQGKSQEPPGNRNRHIPQRGDINPDPLLALLKVLLDERTKILVPKGLFFPCDLGAVGECPDNRRVKLSEHWQQLMPDPVSRVSQILVARILPPGLPAT